MKWIYVHRSSMTPCMLGWYLLMFSGLFLSEKITCSCSSQTGIGVFSTVMVAPCCLCTTKDSTSIHAWLFRSIVFDRLRRQWNPVTMPDLLSLHLFLDFKCQLGRTFLPFFFNFFLTLFNIIQEAFLPLTFSSSALSYFLLCTCPAPSLYPLAKKLLILPEWNPDLIAIQLPFLFFSCSCLSARPNWKQIKENLDRLCNWIACFLILGTVQHWWKTWSEYWTVLLF